MPQATGLSVAILVSTDIDTCILRILESIKSVLEGFLLILLFTLLILLRKEAESLKEEISFVPKSKPPWFYAWERPTYRLPSLGHAHPQPFDK